MDIRHLLTEESIHSETNGVHLVARCIAQEQISRGHAVRIVYFHNHDIVPKYADWDLPVQLIRLQGFKFLDHYISLSSSIIASLIEGASTDTIIHIHGSRRPMLLFIARELWRKGIKYVITIHGRYSHAYDENINILKRKSAVYFWAVERHVLENALFVHALTRHEAAIVGKIAPKARIEIVQNGAYSSSFGNVPLWPNRTICSKKSPVFGFCGRYAVYHKGLDILVRGFGLYLRSGGSGHLQLAGAGSGREELLRLVYNLSLAEFVQIGGPVFGTDKTQAMLGWDFFVQASRFDGHPIGAIEGALNGLPLIVTKATGMDEAVKQFNSGVVLKELSVECLSNSLFEASYIKSNNWINISFNSFDMALRLSDWAVISSQLESLYFSASGT